MTTLIENLRRRSLLVQDIRTYFHEAGYTEIQAPCLIDIPSIEPHIDPLVVVNNQAQNDISIRAQNMRSRNCSPQASVIASALDHVSVTNQTQLIILPPSQCLSGTPQIET